MTRSQATPASSQMITMARMIEERDETIAAQAAMIEKLRTAYVELENFAQSVGGSSCFWEDMNDVLEPASCIANFGTDSKEVLKAWLDEVLGEPVAAELLCKLPLTGWTRYNVYDSVKQATSTMGRVEGEPLNLKVEPLFRKPAL